MIKPNVNIDKVIVYFSRFHLKRSVLNLVTETFGDDSRTSVFGANARNTKIQNLRAYVKIYLLNI